MSNDDRFDNLFMTVAQQAQGIEPLLDQLFGFLRRKTDFYTAPPDKIHAMVMGALKKQGELYDQEQAKKAAAREKEEKRKKAAEAKKKAEKEAKAAAALSSSPAEDDVLELTGDGDFMFLGLHLFHQCVPPNHQQRANQLLLHLMENLLQSLL